MMMMARSFLGEADGDGDGGVIRRFPVILDLCLRRTG